MIEIKRNVNADSRTAETKPIDPVILRAATIEHMADVKKGLLYFAQKLNEAGTIHDYTKLAFFKEFHETISSDAPVKESAWYKQHITLERHHLMSNVPDDVTLIDIFEHLVDCVMAGLARSGNVYDITLPDDILQKAHQNTIKLLMDNVKVVEESSNDT